MGLNMNNVFYYGTISQLGGIETWYYNIAKAYNQYDITILYRTGNEKQLSRLRKYVRCVKWSFGTPITCKRLFVNFDMGVLDFATADEVIFVCHGDYKGLVATGHTKAIHLQNAVKDKRINKFLACSKTARDSFYEITGVKPEVCYNPVSLDEPKRVLRLAIAQRMTNEKGKKRIEKLIKELTRYCMINDTNYVLDVYSNDTSPIDDEHVYNRTPSPDVNRLFGSYDYVISLTDAEGYGYTVVESLCRGTPVVITPVPVFTELGCNERNSIVLEFDCSNVSSVVEQMFTKKLKFKYTPKKSTLDDYLIKEKNTYLEDLTTVKCIAHYRDMQFDKTIREGDILTVDKERADYLVSLGLVIKGG